MITNIVIVGVGGQGTLLASRVLGNVALQEGYDVKVSEVHGMSQRGGSVITFVRYGEKINSPIISEGSADIILAFEQLEALRSQPYIKTGGTIIVNTQKIDPMPVITGAREYPESIIETISSNTKNTIALDALEIAKEAGNPKAVNIVLIGVMAANSNIPKEKWIKSIEDTVDAKFLKVNIEAFKLGYDYKK